MLACSGKNHDRTVTEDGPGLALLQHGSLFDDCFSITRSAIFENQPSVLLATDFVDYGVRYQPENNKSCPRLVAAPKQG